MKKVLKGTLAAAAATALLAGGMGTYATWSDNEDRGSAAVAVGHLTLGATDLNSWVYEGTETAVVQGVVPGDSVTSSTTVTIDASGENIAGEFTVAGLAAGHADARVTIKPNLEGLDAEGLTTNAEGAIVFSEPKRYIFPVELKISFDQGSGTGSDQPDITLSDLTLALTQTR